MELASPLTQDQIGAHLLQGCYTEAERSDAVWLRLDGLRNALSETARPSLTETIEEIRSSSLILRELGDLSQVHQDRGSSILDSLNLALPCLSRSLRDVTAYTEDRSLSKQNRWRNMYHSMAKEAGGLSLSGRFSVYNHFLAALRNLMIRSPNLDVRMLKSTRFQILRLREARDIPSPSTQIGPILRLDTLLSSEMDLTKHWAEKVFAAPLPSRTALKHKHTSTSFGPHKAWGYLNIPAGSTVLFRCTFAGDQISLTVFLDGRDRSPYLLLRTFNMAIPWFALRGAHELCIEREGSSLQLKRWSRSENCSKLWATLYFMTWEELVLVHCTFLSLKARNNLTVLLGPEEHALRSERKIFQEFIIDDGFQHSLIVYEDRKTKGVRLQAAVSDEELRRCPVWTAFVTHQSASPTWLKRASRHKIHLADISLHVFCQRYRQESQRRGFGAFELQFVHGEASYRFEEVLALLRASRAEPSRS